MKNTLQLNFMDKTFLGPCMEKLKTLSPVTFESQAGVPSMSDVLTKPEYIDIRGQVTLTFKNEEDCREFMSTSACRNTYHEFASKRNKK